MTMMEHLKKILKAWSNRRNQALDTSQLSVMLTNTGLVKDDVQACLNYYRGYFKTVQRYRKLPDWNALEIDFPGLFNRRVDRREELDKAFGDERSAVSHQERDSWLNAAGLTNVPWNEEGYLYQAIVELADGESDPGKEGLDVDLWWPDARISKRGQLLSYDPGRSVIHIKVEEGLDRQLLECGFKFRAAPMDFLKKVKEYFDEAVGTPGSLAQRLLDRDGVPQRLPLAQQVVDDQVNASQRAALARVFEQDATFIWGPPGTGKTFTLAKVIAQAMLLGKRVLATGISNIAVDNLTAALVKELARRPEGRSMLAERSILRFGYPVKPEVVKNDDLYPSKEKIKELRKKLAEVVARLSETSVGNSIVRAELINQRDKLRQELKEADKDRIKAAQVVLTTSAMCFLNTALERADYDMVVVDEVSMMPLVQAIAMATFTRDKLVIAGDFRQLGPICVSLSEAAQKWFAKDIYTYLESSPAYKEHGLVMLDQQRRMLEPICGLINERFYDGRLQTHVSHGMMEINGLGFLNIHPVTFVSVPPGNTQGVTQHGSSRRNIRTAEIVLRLVARILHAHPSAGIGLIAPYNGQTSYYREQMVELGWSAGEMDRVKVGTIHSFQGSEYDIIVWDVVDDRNKPIGQLYKGNSGERLVNVAISRAKSKLIIVGDDRLFTLATNSHAASNRLRSLFSEMYMNDKVLVSVASMVAA